MDKLDEIKALVEAKNSLEKPNIFILATIENCTKVIKNLFDEDFKADDIGFAVTDINKISLKKEVNIIHSDNFNLKLNKKEIENLDYTIVCVSCINKRFKENFLEDLKGFAQKIKNIIFVLTDIEFLDERELVEIKTFLAAKLKSSKFCTIMDSKYKKTENETSILVDKIGNSLVGIKKLSFYKSQKIENSYKKEYASRIIENFKNIFSELDDNVSELEFKYIVNSFTNELVQAYGLEDKGEILNKVVLNNIEKILDIRREKVKKVLEELERKKQEELAKLEAERKEQERIKAEAERLEKERLEAAEKERLEKERIRLEEERIDRERKAEEERVRIQAELEAKRLEKLRLEEEVAKKKKMEEALKAERLAKELERKKLREEKAKREKERKAKIIEERLKVEKQKIKKEIEKNRKEEEKKQESKNRINEEVKRINRKVPTPKDIDNEVIIEASFTVDDFEFVENDRESCINEIEVKIDSIIEEVIESKMNEIMIEIKREIKARLKADNII
ncbi:MAG: hypothetical protein ACRC41_05885 [Sarcina sp.]